MNKDVIVHIDERNLQKINNMDIIKLLSVFGDNFIVVKDNNWKDVQYKFNNKEYALCFDTAYGGYYIRKRTSEKRRRDAGGNEWWVPISSKNGGMSIDDVIECLEKEHVDEE